MICNLINYIHTGVLKKQDFDDESITLNVTKIFYVYHFFFFFNVHVIVIVLTF